MMKVKINRAILIMPDKSRNILRPLVTVDNAERYRAELRRLTGAARVIFDMEEAE